MKISTKGRYALRMLLDLSQQPKNQYVALKDISVRQNISKKYLEQIIPLLHKADMLESVRGNNGGYKLRKAPHQISLFDILRHTENECHLIQCHSMDSCENQSQCLARDVWVELDQLIIHYLKNTSLEDILNRKEN